MDLPDRLRLAELLLEAQRSRFGGEKKAAYTAADVNAATWQRLTTAETVKDHTVVKVVAALWPESHGDWTRVRSTLSVVDGPGPSGELDISDLSEELELLRDWVSRPDADRVPPPTRALMLWTDEQLLAAIQAKQDDNRRLVEYIVNQLGVTSNDPRLLERARKAWPDVVFADGKQVAVYEAKRIRNQRFHAGGFAAADAVAAAGEDPDDLEIEEEQELRHDT